MIAAVIFVTVCAGLWAGFAIPPSAKWVIALACGALILFLAALGVHGWQWLNVLAVLASMLAIATPVAGARMAATKWSTPDIYDDE